MGKSGNANNVTYFRCTPRLGSRTAQRPADSSSMTTVNDNRPSYRDSFLRLKPKTINARRVCHDRNRTRGSVDVVRAAYSVHHHAVVADKRFFLRTRNLTGTNTGTIDDNAHVTLRTITTGVLTVVYSQATTNPLDSPSLLSLLLLLLWHMPGTTTILRHLNNHMIYDYK